MAALVAVALVGAGCSSSDEQAANDGNPPAADDSTDDSTNDSADTGDDRTTSADFAEVDRAVESFVADQGLNGSGVVVVERDGGIVHEHYTGDFGPDRVSLIASSSKMLTAGILVKLADDGLLDLDAPVAEQVDWGEANPQVTTAQLLSNSSGLVGLLDSPVYPAYLCQYLTPGTLSECGRQIFTTTFDDADVIPPDTRFRYGGGQWQVAGAVAEAVSGRSWAELVESTYVEPCGVDSLGYTNHFGQTAAYGEGQQDPFRYPQAVDGDIGVLEPTENPNMEGGAYIDPRDYAELLLMHLRGGRCGETQVLSPDSVDRMHTDRVRPAYGGASASGQINAYGLGWWVDNEDPSRIEDSGAFGSVPWLDLADGYGVYLVIEATNDLGRQLAAQLGPLVEEQLGSG